jgi:hypothetical protein
VGADRLTQARVVLTRYDGAAHLVRKVAAAGVRLSGWRAAAGGEP